jgi:DNA-binding CsgD family transcriptional regulator
VVDVPPLVRQVIDTRLGWLDGSALALLQVAAVIGLELPLRLWHAVAAVEDDELANAVEQAQSAALIEELPDRPGYRFRHALVREALYHSLVLPRRRTQHRRVAENLAAQPGADPDAVAYHFRQAGDARAAEWLIRAAERANRAFAFVIAAERYEQALALLGPDDAPPAERGWLLCELAMAYRFADPRRALRYLDDATAIAERVGDAGLRLAVLWARTVTRGLRGERTLDDVLRAADIYAQLSADDRDHLTEDRGHVTPGWGWLAFQLARHGAYDAAARLAERQIDERGASASRRARGETARALAALGLVWAGTGRPEQAREAFARSRALADELGDRHLVSLTITWELMELVLAYHADQPSARHQLNAAAAASWGQLIAFSAPDASSPDMTVFAALLLDGRWDVADAQATDDLERDSLRVDALRLLCELERRRGNVDRARTHLQAALSDGPATRPSTFYFYSILWLQRTGAELALDDGRPDDARPWIEAHDRWLDWSGRVLDRAAGRLLWSRYHLARGEHEHALAHARAALERASEPRQPLALLAAHRDLGRLARLDGDSEGAARHLTEALALAGACAAPYERALVLVERAELAVATGDAAAARADLGEVRALCAPLAAAPLLARAATLQSRLGEGPTPGDVLGLSAREVEVLRLVARGLTDAEVAERLFISPRTVSGHLRSIFSKLDVGSRTAASAIAFERGIV